MGLEFRRVLFRSAHYNRKEQGIVADYVVIMGYDEHWRNGGTAGSVASIGYVEDGIEQTLRDVPADKIINAVPFYMNVWKTTGGEVTGSSVGLPAAKEFLQKNNVTTQWDEETCQNYAEFQNGDSFYQVWLEDAESLAVKLNIMKKYQVAGVAQWKLGLESAEMWNPIEEYVNTSKN